MIAHSNHWEPLLKPAELAENRLVTAILDGTFPLNSTLPSERELAEMLGVTRPTLREALQRLSRDGWVDIHHGKSTRVKDFWREGNLQILTAIAHHKELLNEDFIPQLLQVRLLLAPEYTCMAVEQNREEVQRILESLLEIEDTPQDFSNHDFELHRQLTILSGNPVFTLILNGFGDLYTQMGQIYFTNPKAREYSRSFYRDLLAVSQKGDLTQVKVLVGQVMQASIDLWHQASKWLKSDGGH